MAAAHQRGAPVAQLATRTQSDLPKMCEQEGQEAVSRFLDDAIVGAGSFLDVHGKTLSRYPTGRFNRHESGVSYNPHHDEGEVLICGGPRGILRGGEQVLAANADFSERSLLTILSKALLHAYHVQLINPENQQGPPRIGTTSGTGELRLYDAAGLPAPAIEYAFTTIWDVYLEGDITDDGLRETVLQEWATWYDENTNIRTEDYVAVAYTVSERIREADGTPREQLCYGFDIQEPLLRHGQGDLINQFPD